MQSFDGMSKPCYLIQCQSAAKEMEVQFMLDSYSRLRSRSRSISSARMPICCA